nr:SpaA isopeptide-forming pilin-related protein [uncultured Dorea sp.]
MKENLLQEAGRLGRSNKKKARWKKIMAVLACGVVFCTTYALILPAITMEQNKKPVCTEEQVSGHVHTSECQNEEKELICGYADYVIHTHDENCKDENGHIICGLKEVKEHRHTESCYESKAVQMPDGEQEQEVQTEKALVCKEPEEIYHEHASSCYDEDGNRICGQIQLLRHEHTKECMDDGSDKEDTGSLDNKRAEVAGGQTEEYPSENRTKEADRRTEENQIPDGKEGAASGTGDSHEGAQEAVQTPAESSDTGQDRQKKASAEAGESEETSEKKHRMTYEGKDYTVKAAYSDDAGLPENVTLEVKELKQDSADYKEHYEQAEAALPEDQGILYCRFFDVSFIAEGKEVEPDAPVDVQVSYKDEDEIPVTKGVTASAIHFAEEGIEVLPAKIKQNTKGEDTFNFTQDSFSVVGTAITTINVNSGSYVFYKEGYAMGVSGSALTAVEVTVNENGYVYPKNTSYSIDNITWTYSNGSWRNKASGKYLYLQDKEAIASTSAQPVDMRIINNTIRISKRVNTNAILYMGFNKDSKKYTVGGLFANGDYFLAAKIETVSEGIVTPGTISIDDQIKEEGVLKAKLNTTAFNGRTLTYTWYRRDNSSGSWKEVTRKRITGESYNVAEDGSWLNVALDGGADKEYMVKIASVNGNQIGYNVASVEYHVPYYAQIQNGDFENPKIPTQADDNEHYQPFLPNGTAGMVWKTTASDQKVEYISVASRAFKEMSTNWHNCESAARGNQYVELNATQSGALYQDVLTVPGSTMYWRLAHRGRGPSNMKDNANMIDTMYVVVMSTKLAEAYDITTQAKVLDVINRTYAYPGAKVETVKDNNKQWYYHNGQYDVPDSQYLTRYFFVAGETAYDKYSPGSSIQYTVGNHLDDIHFSTELPPPAAGKVNLEVAKTIRGLDEEQARNLLNQMQFIIDGATVKGSAFRNFTNNGDGSYTASYQVQLSIGSASSVTKSAEELMSTTKVEGYRLKSVSASVNGGTKKESNEASVTIKDQGSGSIEFENTYEQETETMRIVKVDERNQALTGVKFALDENTQTGWQTIEKSMQVNSEGRIQLPNMKRDTLYRLTELETQDGYQLLTNKVYFKIVKTNGEARLIPCTETGEQVSDWPDHVRVLTYDQMELKVINEKGAELPATGGMGTGEIYMAGMLMILSAMVLYGYYEKKKQEGRGDH